MTLDECEDTARRVAMGLPPSDFGSTRAIQAFAQTLRAAILQERERCSTIVQLAREGEIDGDFRSLIHRIANPSPNDSK